MIILGIDPGPAFCGYGLLANSQGLLKPLTYGAITTSSKISMPNRLEKIFDELNDLIKEYQPNVMGIEKLFFGRNSTTAIPVGQARGIVLLCAVKNNLQIIEKTPNEIKQAVTGYGGATKQQIIFMVTKLLHLIEEPKPDDVADALAVAICTAHSI